MDAILLGIDGTGELPDTKYHHEMKHSFVNYITKHTGAKWKQYMRGPAFEGLDMFAISRKGHEFVHLHRELHKDAKIFLTGYSRGGAAVVEVAKFLARDGVKVDAMMLFDPVDRSLTSSADVVPGNVLQLCIARRKYDTFSRVSFNNCALDWEGPGVPLRRSFWATHGGLGGVPWHREGPARPQDYISEGLGELALMTAVYDVAAIKWVPEPGDVRTQDAFLQERWRVGNHTLVTYEQDRIGARQVWQWAEPWLKERGMLPA